MPCMASSNSVMRSARQAMYITIMPTGIEIARSANRANFEVPSGPATYVLLHHTATPIKAEANETRTNVRHRFLP